MCDSSNWKQQYFGFLNKPRWSEMRIEDARLLKARNLPASLFKYASLSAEKVPGQPWTLINLKDQVVSLRPPSTFNDPYDSCLSFMGTSLLNDQIVRSGRTPLEGTPLANLPDAQDLPPCRHLKTRSRSGFKRHGKKTPKHSGRTYSLSASLREPFKV